jgi:hypothetical protein
MIAIAQLLISAGQIFFLWKISRDIYDLADESRRKDDLSKRIAEFGEMFTDAAGKVSGKKKVVSFVAKNE